MMNQLIMMMKTYLKMEDQISKQLIASIMETDKKIV
jgi:hypothetical protein